MNTKIIMITAFILFLLASIFSGLKIWQVKRITHEKAELQTKYDLKQLELDQSKLALIIREKEYIQLMSDKVNIEDSLAQYKAITEHEIELYQRQIANLQNIPADTIYRFLFTKYPTNLPLKYPFAENQIRSFHLNYIERDHFKSLSDNVTAELNQCTSLNEKNNSIITNLNEQNNNLKGQNGIIIDQNSILQDELNLSAKELRKQKRKTFMFKGTTVVSLAGFIFVALK